MPAFSGMLTDQQIVALADYVRSRYSRGPAWNNVPAALAEAHRRQTPAMEAP
jgi:mono/diheme cytochrome c family protein